MYHHFLIPCAHTNNKEKSSENKGIIPHSSYFSVNLKEENQMAQQLWAFSIRLTLLQEVSWHDSGNNLLSPTWSAGFLLGQIIKRWLRTECFFPV